METASEEEDEDEARELFRSLVGFQDRLVREVMTPRPDIVAIRADATLGDLRARLRESEYSRLLVYGQSLDDVVGFVHMKDVFLKGATRGDDEPFTALVRAAHVVPATKRAPELLKELQRTRTAAHAARHAPPKPDPRCLEEPSRLGKLFGRDVKCDAAGQPVKQ